MDKRYQVFVSSTFKDLIKERSLVMDILYKHKCLPVGMENFPSLTIGSLPYIYRLIDESDFFLLILNGVYGSSRDADGRSFTHLEWLHALEIQKPVIVLYRKDWKKHTKLEEDTNDAVAFTKFFNEVKARHDGAKPWKPNTLAALVIEAIDQAIIDNPHAVGWVRSDTVEKQPISDNDILGEEKKLCRSIADKILTDIDYDNWYEWTSWLTSADGPSLDRKRARALENSITYIKSAIWPDNFQQVKAAFENFAAVAKDLLDQFFKHTEIRSATSDRYTTKKFYKIPEDNPHYEEDAAKYDKHVDIIHAYTFELTKAINYVCNIIRRDIDKTYRAVEGKRYITNGYEPGGFHNYFPEYSDEELKDGKSPYPGAQEFFKRYK